MNTFIDDSVNDTIGGIGRTNQCSLTPSNEVEPAVLVTSSGQVGFCPVDGTSTHSSRRPSSSKMHSRGRFHNRNIHWTLAVCIAISFYNLPTALSALSLSSSTTKTKMNTELDPSNNARRMLQSLPSPSPTASPDPSSMPSGFPHSHPSVMPSLKPTSSPSSHPSKRPTSNPSDRPSSSPSNTPSSSPSNTPSSNPTSTPSNMPSSHPSKMPSSHPSNRPSSHPSNRPSRNPSISPSTVPSHSPSVSPSQKPSAIPTTYPSSIPSKSPSGSPSGSPSTSPSSKPTTVPSITPSTTPSSSPTSMPTTYPSDKPSSKPSQSPSAQPTSSPSVEPSSKPSQSPSSQPTNTPSTTPSLSTSPSSSPSNSPTSAPSKSPSAIPSAYPSVNPTREPSSMPSNSPSYSLQQEQLTIKMAFDDLPVFAGGSDKIFILEAQRWIDTTLDNTGDDFDVTVSIENKKIIYPEQFSAISSGGDRLLSKVNDNHIGVIRNTQNVEPGLQVTITVTVTVRSATTYDTNSLTEIIEDAIDSPQERESFIAALQLADNAAFQRINTMQITINGKEVQVEEPSSSVPWIYIGPAIGGGALIISVLGFFFFRRRDDDNSYVENEFYDPPPVDPLVAAGEIEVVDDFGDMSTLGFDHGNANQAMFAAVQDEDEETNQSTISADYDYKRAYGGAGDAPSFSTAGGNQSAFTPHSLADRMTEEDSMASRQRFDSVGNSSNTKSVAGNISLFSEDNSFEAMYSQEEKIIVFAPAGKLGVVIDAPSHGVPMVHAIKDTSVLADRVRIGDRLVAVDNSDTTNMSAIQVSKLISSKAMNPTRKMVFIRVESDP